MKRRRETGSLGGSINAEPIAMRPFAGQGGSINRSLRVDQRVTQLRDSSSVTCHSVHVNLRDAAVIPSFQVSLGQLFISGDIFISFQKRDRSSSSSSSLIFDGCRFGRKGLSLRKRLSRVRVFWGEEKRKKKKEKKKRKKEKRAARRPICLVF